MWYKYEPKIHFNRENEYIRALCVCVCHSEEIIPTILDIRHDGALINPKSGYESESN